MHYTDEDTQNKKLLGIGKDKVFTDPEWDIRKELQSLQSIDPDNKEKVILERLSQLYPKNKELRPAFFPELN